MTPYRGEDHLSLLLASLLSLTAQVTPTIAVAHAHTQQPCEKHGREAQLDP
jgi:hypothetical protein